MLLTRRITAFLLSTPERGGTTDTQEAILATRQSDNDALTLLLLLRPTGIFDLDEPETNHENDLFPRLPPPTPRRRIPTLHAHRMHGIRTTTPDSDVSDLDSEHRVAAFAALQEGCDPPSSSSSSSQDEDITDPVIVMQQAADFLNGRSYDDSTDSEMEDQIDEDTQSSDRKLLPLD